MAVVEVRSVLLLDRKLIGVVVSGLDGVLCHARNTVVPWPVNLVDPMPVRIRHAGQHCMSGVGEKT